MGLGYALRQCTLREENEMGRRAIDMDDLVMDMVLSTNMDDKKTIAKKITDIAYKKGIYSSSINGLYMARGKNEFPGTFTAPAVNLRTLTYDLARAIFRCAKRNNAGAFIFEIAKSEM